MCEQHEEVKEYAICIKCGQNKPRSYFGKYAKSSVPKKTCLDCETNKKGFLVLTSQEIDILKAIKQAGCLEFEDLKDLVGIRGLGTLKKMQNKGLLMLETMDRQVQARVGRKGKSAEHRPATLASLTPLGNLYVPYRNRHLEAKRKQRLMEASHAA